MLPLLRYTNYVLQIGKINRNIHKQPNQRNFPYLPLTKLQKQICHLFTQMLKLQNTICRKIPNTLSNKVKESQKRHQGPKCYLSLQTFQLKQPDYNTHGKCTIIEQLRNITSLSTEILKERLKKEKTC